MHKILFFIVSMLKIMTCYADEHLVLIADPKVLAVPIQENHEPMVDLSQQQDISYGSPPLIPNNKNYTKIRKSVYEKLKKAQAMLPSGIKFRLYEGYRSLALQQQIFDERYNLLKKENPKLSHAQLFIESTKFVSPVINLDGSKNVPPHATGAAIDVYLINTKGEVLDMGIHLDDTYLDLHGDFCKTDSNAISLQAKQYRIMMGRVLEAVGFVNYPTEYWHWSYGDRYWAYQTHQPVAFYDIYL